MPPFIPTLIILSAAGLAILFVLYRFYDKQVEEPRKLDDEINDALEGYKSTIISVEPVRQAAVCLSVPGDRLIIVRQFGEMPTLRLPLSAILGIEFMVDGKVLARVIRGSAHKMIDDSKPQGQEISIRFIIDDLEFPSYELLLWQPSDGGTARSEGHVAAMNHARKWFYSIEALMLKPRKQNKTHIRNIESGSNKTEPGHIVRDHNTSGATHDQNSSDTDNDRTSGSAKAPPSKSEADVLNAPIIPYI